MSSFAHFPQRKQTAQISPHIPAKPSIKPLLPQNEVVAAAASATTTAFALVPPPPRNTSASCTNSKTAQLSLRSLWKKSGNVIPLNVASVSAATTTTTSTDVPAAAEAPATTTTIPQVAIGGSSVHAPSVSSCAGSRRSSLCEAGSVPKLKQARLSQYLLPPNGPLSTPSVEMDSIATLSSSSSSSAASAVSSTASASIDSIAAAHLPVSEPTVVSDATVSEPSFMSDSAALALDAPLLVIESPTQNHLDDADRGYKPTTTTITTPNSRRSHGRGSYSPHTYTLSYGVGRTSDDAMRVGRTRSFDVPSPIDRRYLARIQTQIGSRSATDAIVMQSSVRTTTTTTSSSSSSSSSSTDAPLSRTTSLRALQQVSAQLDISDRFLPARRGVDIDGCYGLAQRSIDVGAVDGDNDDVRCIQENVAPAGSVIGVTGARVVPITATGAALAAAGKHLPFGNAYKLLLHSELLGRNPNGQHPARMAASGSVPSTVEPLETNAQLIIHRTSTAAAVTSEGAPGSLLAGLPHTSNTPAATTLAASSSLQHRRSPLRDLTQTQTYHFSTPRTPTNALRDPWQTNHDALSVSTATQRLLGKHRPPAQREIAKVPFRVLDAPNIKDDFYLNLVDWSSQNVIAVALGAAVFLWSGITAKVTKLCEFDEDTEQVTSVAWTLRGAHLAVGLKSGIVQIWDATSCKCVRTLAGHSNRIGAMSWNSSVIATGSRDRSILLHDPRAASVGSANSASAPGGSVVSTLSYHRQEVCGMKWSPDGQQLASGGNDNRLLIWSPHQKTTPLHKFEEHTAAVKAIAWSPHQHGLICSGGGTADRCIRFWSTQGSGSALSHIDTGSQVCNLLWSANCNELVSSHGYSLNQIIAWKYPSMQQIVTLTGHSMRVLYLAISPCGQTLLSGGGDETLRLFNLFPSSNNQPSVGRLKSTLVLPTNLDTMIR